MPTTLAGFKILAQSLEREILQGAYKVGEKLPSLREITRQRAYGKNTVIAAFELLVARGLVEPRRGAGFYVKDIAAPPDTDTPEHALGRAKDLVWLIREQLKDNPQAIRAADGMPPAEWLAGARLDRVHHKVARGGLGALFSYGNRYGYLPLRQQLVRKLGGLGIETDPRQILMTHGANQAMDLVLRYLIPPGGTVLVDDPGYYFLFGKLKVHGAEIAGIPRQADGPDLEVLEQVLIRKRPRLFFVQSVGHNPTGSDISADKARRLLDLAEKYNLLLVEMDPLADLKPHAQTRLSALDQLQRTIYIGSFSKSLSAALRVGFIACSADMASELADLKSIVHVSSSEYAERTVDAVLRERTYARHIAALNAHVAQATRQSRELLSDAGARFFCDPAQSLYMWVRFDGLDDSLALSEYLTAEQITVAPGRIFSVDPGITSPWMRLNTGLVVHEKFQAMLRRRPLW
ncbi:MAG: PLP-dependent aminotransferase family protein [Comamonas sp.]